MTFFSAIRKIILFKVRWELQNGKFITYTEFLEALFETFEDAAEWIANLGDWMDIVDNRLAFVSACKY